MAVSLTLILLGIALRLPDRLHFARSRPHTGAVARLMALQRERANNHTPVLLLLGQWVQVVGWWGVAAAGGPLGMAVCAAAVAVHFRHLQEISHFAVHRVLTRSPRLGDLLAEHAVHRPLGLVPVPVRRQRHVRDHHPNATGPGDPNLAELRTAGLRPGTPRIRFALALVHPLTPCGAWATARTLAVALCPRPGAPARCLTAIAVLTAAYLTGGWDVVLCGVLLPRLLLYPQLAWMSLIVEHTWFDPDRRSGAPVHIEAGRCLRLYPRNRLLSVLAATTWLPYGDLHHFAHSAHPALRWNFLLPAERHLGQPHFTPHALLLGPGSVVARHRRALTTCVRAPQNAPSPDAGLLDTDAVRTDATYASNR